VGECNIFGERQCGELHTTACSFLNSNMNKNNFLEILHHLADNSLAGDELAEMSGQLMKAFLDFGSETPDNLNCFQNVEYGLVINRIDGANRDKTGLKLKGRNVLISEVMNVVEDLEIPAEVKEYYPKLTKEQWSAITRITTMVLISLERRVKVPGIE
jgi:hypothetical protein